MRRSVVFLVAWFVNVAVAIAAPQIQVDKDVIRVDGTNKEK